MPNRFQDENKILSDFYGEVWVKCPQCNKKAIATADYDKKEARLYCESCGYNKQTSTETSVFGIKGNWEMAAHGYFNAKLWLQYSFKNDVFYAYNNEHLHYLEQYIAAGLREHKNRKGFTLLEKLPKFYHEAKNRGALLRIIQKLKVK
ncbi:hypothetical protein SAMN05421741_11626 [Paenimyroides ummariense]|uniref:Transposase zinc-ribbon domain-containing protein n=1 Tax=Paenimyroides ummariense TaxID=913024 RepID=A0A1I5DKY1_9FLAO|nr:hypothetical protein [Paenimyroides ummariense]SFN99451.1 hypothetical protein SAMN05421741_11626 [Paenimyroides ummariense]